MPPPADTARIPGRVIFVGQIIPDKGLDLLLDAIALLRARGIDATLDVVGEIDGWEAPEYRGYRAALRDRARQPDLAGAVKFLGYREDVPTLLGRASVHCCPSRPEHREGFGLVVLEAKLAGLPSVVTPERQPARDWSITSATAGSCPRADAAGARRGARIFPDAPGGAGERGPCGAGVGRPIQRGAVRGGVGAGLRGADEIEHAHAL